MNLYAARNLAVSLMRQHGLHDWTFRFDHARRRFGSCQYGRRIITLSRYLAFLNDEAQVRDTILHEIAHALAPGDGHGERWKRACLQVGATPQRCYGDEQVISPPRRTAPFEIGCMRCNWWAERHRRTRRKLVCRTCRSPITIRINPAASHSADAAIAR